MNRFFSHTKDRFHETIPARSYGKVEHIEISENRQSALVAIDLMEADWFDKQDPQKLQDFPLDLLSRKHSKGPGPGAEYLFSPYDSAKLYRLEVEVDLKDLDLILGVNPRHWGGLQFDDKATAFLENHWFEFTTGSTQDFGNKGSLYVSLYSPPLEVYTKAKLISPSEEQRLIKVVNLNAFPAITPSGLNTLISRADADHLAAYDVGQGNCNGLLDVDYIPSLYYDLGAGVFRNAQTTPSNLEFCFSRRPMILLSHWDTDHWAGAFAALSPPTKGTQHYEALRMQWVAPSQQITILHYVFALEIQNQGGSIRIFDTPGFHQAYSRKSGYTFEYWLGIGNDRNGTGIVLNVQHHTLPTSWLLTGDCDYGHFPTHPSGLTPLAVIAPHHGAKIANAASIPTPYSVLGYHRLVYSFGPNNTHGRRSVSHPRQAALRDHHAAGWDHAASFIANPGSSLIGGQDVRATSEHNPGTARAGVLIGWQHPSWGLQRPCKGRRCAAAPTI